MYRVQRPLLALAMLVTLPSCGHSPPAPQDTIPVAAVLNALVCGLAEGVRRSSEDAAEEAATHKTPRFKDLLAGQTATIKLELKTIDSSSFSAGINAAKTSVIKFGWGGLAPTLGVNHDVSWTVTSTIVLAYQLDGYNADVCAAADLTQQMKDGDRFGFSVWLGNTLSALARVSNIGQTSSRSITYDSNFGVTTGGNVGATFSPIMILPVSVSTDGSRNDVQHLNVVIGKPAPAGGGAAAAAAAGRNLSLILEAVEPLNQKPAPVSLSRVAPAI